MAQTPVTLRSEGNVITFTPAAAHAAGTVIVRGTNLVTVACDDFTADDLAAGKRASAYTTGLFNFPKDNSDFSAVGLPVYWDDNADPYGGTAGSGALSDSSADGPLAGFTNETAGTTTGDVDILLRSVDSATVPGVLAAMPTRTLAATGTVIGNSAAIEGTGITLVTASDNNKGVQLPATPTGKVVIVKNGVADAVLKVYPQVNSKVNALSANASYNQPADSFRMFIGYNATTWLTDPATPT